jgi:hypothetical protein
MRLNESKGQIGERRRDIDENVEFEIDLFPRISSAADEKEYKNAFKMRFIVCRKLKYKPWSSSCETPVFCQDTNCSGSGHDLSTADKKTISSAYFEVTDIQKDGQQKDGPVQTGQTLEMVRGTGFEPVGSTLQQQPLTGQGTQGGTQIPSDPIWARLVTAWPTLSDERKKIISTMIDLP